MKKFKIYVRGRLTDDGEYPIVSAMDRYTSFEAIVRENKTGSFTLTVPDGTDQARWLTGFTDENGVRQGGPGAGIVVFPEDSNEPVFSGPIRTIKREWDTNNSGLGTITVSGPDDNVLMAERLAWPAPNEQVENQHVSATWVPTYDGRQPRNVLETITSVLRTNMDNPARPDRKVPGLVIPTVVSETVPDDPSGKILRVRFTPIDELVMGLAKTYGVRVRFVWTPSIVVDGTTYYNQIVARITPVVDRTDQVIFAEDFGNLKGFEYSLSAPKATRLIIGTQGQARYRWFDEHQLATDPTFVDVYDRSPMEAEWGVTKEEFKDRRDIEWEASSGYPKVQLNYTMVIDGTPYIFPVRDSKTGAISYRSTWRPGAGQPFLQPPAGTKQAEALEDEVDAFTVENAPTGMYKLDCINIPNMEFLTDFDLGDVVQVIIDGVPLDEQVREVKLVIQEDEVFKINLTVGTEEATETPYLYRQIRSLWNAVYSTDSLEDLESPFGSLKPEPPTIEAPEWSLNGANLTVNGTVRVPIPGLAPVVYVEYRDVGHPVWDTVYMAPVNVADDPDGDNTSWVWDVTKVFTTGILVTRPVEFRARVEYPTGGDDLDDTISEYSNVVRTVVADDPELPQPPAAWVPQITTPSGNPPLGAAATGQTVRIAGNGLKGFASNLPNPGGGTQFMRIQVYRDPPSPGGSPSGPLLGEVRANSEGDWAMNVKMQSNFWYSGGINVNGYDGPGTALWVSAISSVNGRSWWTTVWVKKKK